jgi:hypothetical protein
MTQNHTLNMPEGSEESERRAERGGCTVHTMQWHMFFSELQPSGLIARKSHNGTVLSAEKKAVLKKIIGMNIDL